MLIINTFQTTFNMYVDIKICKADNGISCDVPFVYQGEYYDSCINVDNGGIPWCYTNSTKKDWGTCSFKSCSTLQSRFPIIALL